MKKHGKLEKVSDVGELKKQLRSRLRDFVKSRSLLDREDDSQLICSQIMNERIYLDSSSILFYASLPDEVNVRPLMHHALNESKNVFLPRYIAREGIYEAVQIQDIENDLEEGQFGIAEPRGHCGVKPLKRLDLILVPGLGFSRNGNRLGRGGGFYDRMLFQINGVTCGLAFDCQVIDSMPTEQHDVRVDNVMTPTRWYKIRQANNF